MLSGVVVKGGVLGLKVVRLLDLSWHAVFVCVCTTAGMRSGRKSVITVALDEQVFRRAVWALGLEM